jgi:hypothetical protein
MLNDVRRSTGTARAVNRSAARVARVLAVALVVMSCGGQQQSPAGRGGDSVVSETATSVAGQAGVLPTWRLVSWEPHAGVDPTDLGVGVVFARRAEDKGATFGTDTLIVRSAPNVSAAAVGAMLFTVATNGVTSYQVAAPDSLRPNLVEYGYEESGIPFDSADASGRWLRAILGFGAGESVRIGWVDATQPGVGVIRWVEQLAEGPLFYQKPERAAFFAAPDSSRPVPPPGRGNDEYAMYPVEVRGPWMHVRLVTPSDNCVGPDSIPRQTRHAWIRYLDDRGRPNVWYHTRGC